MNQKLNISLGFHNYISSELLTRNNTEYIKSTDSVSSLIEILNTFHTVKTNLHLSAGLLSYLDKHSVVFSSTIRELLERNQIELISGGIYEPLFPCTPKEDRQTHLLLMNRLLNHVYGYNPFGAWITELSWEPSLALDLAKSRLQYTCLPKEYFLHAGLKENDISGYYLTEDEGRKIAIFPLLLDLNQLIEKNSPIEALDRLLSEHNQFTSNNNLITLFYKEQITKEKTTWLKSFFELIQNNKNIETRLFNEYLSSNKPKGLIYLPIINSIHSEDKHTYWKNSLLKNHELNLLHKKMLRVSKKINAAKEGKSRFKTIKEMISQAQDLLLKGQCIDGYTNGAYTLSNRHNTYSNLIKAENLIDAASRMGSNWIQVFEIDYDCDGNDEIIIETETQNLYISGALGGTILENDYRPKNLNLTNTTSQHLLNTSSKNDNHLKLSLVDHFLKEAPSLEQCTTDQLKHLTNEIIYPYQAEKIKAKEETCKITLNSPIALTKISETSIIDLKKQIFVRSGDSSIIFDYTLTNKSPLSISLVFAVEFNFNVFSEKAEDCYFYIDADKQNKTSNSDLFSPEELKNINQISIFNKSQGVDLSLWWSKPCTLFKYPIENALFKNIYHGTTILPTWKITLEPEISFEISIKQDIQTNTVYEG